MILLRKLSWNFVWGACVLASLGTTREALPCDCTGGVPYRFEIPSPNPYPAKFVSGFTTYLDVYGAAGSRRLVLRENYGYAIFSLTNPAMPVYANAMDIEGIPGYTKSGDGFQTVGDVAAAPDSSRLLVNYTQSDHGTMLMSSTAGPLFNFAGEFGSSSGNIAIAKLGSRYIGFNLQNTLSGLKAADVTAFVVGPAANTLGSITSSTVAGSPGSQSAPTAAGNFLVYGSTSGLVVVVDLSVVGPPGVTLASGFVLHTFLPTAFGFPAGSSITGATGAVNPADGQLYVLAEAISGTTALVALARSADGVTFTSVGSPFVPTSFTSPQGALALVATASDLVGLFWERNGATGVSKLYTMSASGWGTDLTPALTVDPSVYTDFPRAFRMKAFASGSQIYSYIGAQQAGYAISLVCSGLSDAVAPTVTSPSAVTVTQTLCQ